MASKHIVNCPYCFQLFKKKGCYEKHILYCQQTMSNVSNGSYVSNESNGCNKEKVPNTGQLYELITTLTEKYNTVQSELESLKRHINIKNKRIDVLTWLNEQPIPSSTWSMCMEHFTISVDDIEAIFKNGFIDGALEIINSYLYQEETRQVLKCFEQKNNILYVFDGGEWKELKNDEFKVIFNDIYKKILGSFDEYKNKNQYRMNNEDFQTEYSNNFMKIICVNLTTDIKCTRIKNKIYNEFKESFKTIVELDI